MTYFSQSINAPAEGATFAMRLKFYCILFISVMLLLPVPWLVAVISLTMLWHGLIGWTYKTSPAQWIGRKVNASAQWLGAIMLKDVRNSPYLISLFGVGILTPALFIFSFWWQSQQTHFNWWAVLAYHVITYGPYFAFFSQVATLIHKEGHEPKGFFKALEFYSPVYNAQTAVNRPDQRTTIFWKPDVITDAFGNSTFNFFNADGKGTYRVEVQGMDSKGNLGLQVLRYKVE